MTTEDPAQIRRQIEHTQRNLSADVDALTEKVAPGRIAQRQANRVRRGFRNVRDRVMGTASDTASSAGGRMSDVATAVSDRASAATDAVAEAPQAIRRGTEGNPLAAGLIAFGLGWLTASLVPASKAEQQMAERAKDLVQEHAGAVGEVAGQVKDNLREPAQQAVANVKSTAQDAASTVAEDTKAAAGDVADRAQEAKHSLQDRSSG